MRHAHACELLEGRYENALEVLALGVERMGNTTGPAVLYPLYITNAFTNNSPTTTMLAQFRLGSQIAGGLFADGWSLGAPLLFGNGNTQQGR